MKTLLIALIALFGIAVATPEAQARHRDHRHRHYSHGHKHYRHYPYYRVSRPRYYYHTPVRYYRSSYHYDYCYPRTYYYRRPAVSFHIGF